MCSSCFQGDARIILSTPQSHEATIGDRGHHGRPTAVLSIPWGGASDSGCVLESPGKLSGILMLGLHSQRSSRSWSGVQLEIWICAAESENRRLHVSPRGRQDRRYEDSHSARGKAAAQGAVPACPTLPD